jgi:putative addiction module component (TIGR02574 family)
MAMQDVLDAALRLSEDERRELAECLYESLGDFEETPHVEHLAEWTAVIERRLTEIREGRAKLVDGEEVIARAYARIEAARRHG